MEDGEGLCCVQRDEHPHQELLVFSLQRQGKTINDAEEEKKTVTRKHTVKNEHVLLLPTVKNATHFGLGAFFTISSVKCFGLKE